ncbi:hypothetical protein FDP41_003784 [Naegleria fowleri]|uniref:Uncharacterized protein n=1 Tax=Naegleria fowleri TaxID=5763 RepID=A0A6A5BS47_NAEFO|nr:uncharacterized protein FDP41_003784 [Naegleria fowleri]KAF0977131.1 hypothetical protein FDP41_003784 [Naegleria fowleri]
MKFAFDAEAKASKLSEWFESSNMVGLTDLKKHFIVDADVYGWKNFRLLSFGVYEARRDDCFLKEKPDSFFHYGNLDPTTKKGRERLEYAVHGVLTCCYFADYLDTSEENKDIHSWATSHHPNGKNPIRLIRSSYDEVDEWNKLGKGYKHVKTKYDVKLFYDPSVVTVKPKKPTKREYSARMSAWWSKFFQG